MGVKSETAIAPSLAEKPRMDSVDLVRGLVMVIMALDHVRDYFSDRLFLDPVDLRTTTPGVFFTRWITHYCAPVFIFLAGTGAYLSATRGKSKAALSWFLVSRGVWLVLLEFTFVKFCWAFQFDLYAYGGAVIWTIGCSMILLAGLIHLPWPLIAAFGLVQVIGHNAFDGWSAEQVGLPEPLWITLHRTGEFPVYGKFRFGTGYCLIPWSGVMALGYCFGRVLQWEPNTRRRALLILGCAATCAFILLRWANVYGDASRWQTQSSDILSLCSFLNCTKYPPSLLYLLMTLGPAILCIAVFESAKGPLARILITFGRVPMFFYLLHIPLIHGAKVLLDYVQFGWSPMATNGPWVMFFDSSQAAAAGGFGEQLVYYHWLAVASSFGFDLPMVYLIWLIIVGILYVPCRWFADVKKRRRDAWLSYL